MKNIILIIISIILMAPSCEKVATRGYESTGTGWEQVRKKQHFKDSTNFDKIIKIGNDTVATQAYARGYGGTETLSSADTANMLSHYIERADTASMLLRYIERKDTASMLLHYALLSEIVGISSGDVATQINDSLTARLAAAEEITDQVLIHIGDTTVTESLGRIVYKTSNNHFYGCVYVGSAHPSWKQLDN